MTAVANKVQDESVHPFWKLGYFYQSFSIIYSIYNLNDILDKKPKWVLYKIFSRTAPMFVIIYSCAYLFFNKIDSLREMSSELTNPLGDVLGLYYFIFFLAIPCATSEYLVTGDSLKYKKWTIYFLLLLQSYTFVLSFILIPSYVFMHYMISLFPDFTSTGNEYNLSNYIVSKGWDGTPWGIVKMQNKGGTLMFQSIGVALVAHLSTSYYSVLKLGIRKSVNYFLVFLWLSALSLIAEANLSLYFSTNFDGA